MRIPLSTDRKKPNPKHKTYENRLRLPILVSLDVSLQGEIPVWASGYFRRMALLHGDYNGGSVTFTITAESHVVDTKYPYYRQPTA